MAGSKKVLVRSVMMLGGRLIDPVSPSTHSNAPCQASKPARVTTKDGTPNWVTMKPLKAPIAQPIRSAAMIPRSGDQPCWTESTAMTAAARPLTAPTERSISPRSRTSTTPIEIVAIAAICRVRFERLTALRKRSLAIWKIVQISAIPRITRTEARSPRASAAKARRTEKPSTASTGAVPIVGSLEASLTAGSPRWLGSRRRRR